MSLLPSWLRLGSPHTKMDPCPCASHDSLTIIEKAELLQDQLVDAKSQKVQWLVETIAGTHAELLKLPDLKPGKAINQLLGNLVTICSEIYDRDVVDNVKPALASRFHNSIKLTIAGPHQPPHHSHPALPPPNLRPCRVLPRAALGRAHPTRPNPRRGPRPPPNVPLPRQLRGADAP